MTTPGYHDGCPEPSKVHGCAWSASPNAANADNAWSVNFNNGNDNWNNKNNNNSVRLVRGECDPSTALVQPGHATPPDTPADEIGLRELERLIELRGRLGQGVWRPSPAACFITLHPKAREIHAPDFADRVVHHWLVPRLERIYEPVFIHDSHANRKGHGTHAAVARLQGFTRQVVDGECARRKRAAGGQALSRQNPQPNPPPPSPLPLAGEGAFLSPLPLEGGGAGGESGQPFSLVPQVKLESLPRSSVGTQLPAAPAAHASPTLARLQRRSHAGAWERSIAPIVACAAPHVGANSFAHRPESSANEFAPTQATCGYALQLDVRNFFNRIHRPTLYALLMARLLRVEQRGQISAQTRRSMQTLCHALLARHPAERVRYRDDAATRARVPEHKRLENAPPGCGLPIGNLTSQFFANVYLKELDQFVKHQLKCRHYVRYVDDFVLLHPSAAQLDVWKHAIEHFLAEKLKPGLKPDIRLKGISINRHSGLDPESSALNSLDPRLRGKDENGIYRSALKPISAGVDFLGYVISPHTLRIRQRIYAHADERIGLALPRTADGVLGVPQLAFTRLCSVLASYQGHAAHAGLHAALTFAWRQLAHSARLRAQGIAHGIAEKIRGRPHGLRERHLTWMYVPYLSPADPSPAGECEAFFPLPLEGGGPFSRSDRIYPGVGGTDPALTPSPLAGEGWGEGATASNSEIVNRLESFPCSSVGTIKIFQRLALFPQRGVDYFFEL